MSHLMHHESPAEREVREAVRMALQSERVRRSAADISVTVTNEGDLEQLLALIRQVGSNSLLNGAPDQDGASIVVRVRPGALRPSNGTESEGCCDACSKEQRGGVEKVTCASLETPQRVGGLISESRLQSMAPKPSVLLMEHDAVLTPAARDWLRGHKIQIQRGSP